MKKDKESTYLSTCCVLFGNISLIAINERDSNEFRSITKKSIAAIKEETIEIMKKVPVEIANEARGMLERLDSFTGDSDLYQYYAGNIESEARSKSVLYSMYVNRASQS